MPSVVWLLGGGEKEYIATLIGDIFCFLTTKTCFPARLTFHGMALYFYRTEEVLHNVVVVELSHEKFVLEPSQTFKAQSNIFYFVVAALYFCNEVQ